MRSLKCRLSPPTGDVSRISVKSLLFTANDASDPKVSVALRFAQQVVRTRGEVDDRDLAAVQAAGWQGSEIVEIVGHVLSTTLTNYLHHLSDVPIDYPTVPFAEDDDA
jgi:alkylhydroperoxidase family enzyme